MLSLSLLTPAHNTPAQKVKTQEFGDGRGADGEKEENGKSLSVEKFVVVGSMFTPSLIDVV